MHAHMHMDGSNLIACNNANMILITPSPPQPQQGLRIGQHALYLYPPL